MDATRLNSLDLPTPVNVLLIGTGGREHALAWKLRQSPHLGGLWVADGDGNPIRNVGLLRTAREAPPEETDLANAFRIQRWCDRESIHLVVVGPEAPLAAGAADVLRSPTRLVFGPGKAGAQLEADKAFAKQFMRNASIPTADSRVFTDAAAATRFVHARGTPCVVKASGLASGKGVVVCNGVDEAVAAIDRMLVKAEFGDAGRTIVIEERLNGPEVSVLALTDGRTLWILDPCQDHKRLGDGDVGPNTGGMGAYCPAAVLDADGLGRVQREIFVPVLSALAREGIEYRGVLYAGLMATPGGPKVLEFNCRFGDPECQVLLPRLRSDLLELLWATAAGTLDKVEVEFDPRACCCVVMAAEGYPSKPVQGAKIEGLAGLASLPAPDETLEVFHAGTASTADGSVVTAGGRVLGVTALAADLAAARRLANSACEQITFRGAQWRRDIGSSALPPS